MIKRTFMIMVGCLFCGIMRAQLHQRLFDEFLKEAGDQAEMFLGKVEQGYPSTICINLPYWKSNDFLSGDVKFNGVLYRDVSIRFDAYQQQLVVKTPVKHTNVCVPMDWVEEFVLDGMEFSRRDGEFVVILFNSPRMELVEKLNVNIDEKFANNMKVQYEFKHRWRYLLLRDGQVYEVNKLKSVLKLFPELKKELKSFAKIHYLDFTEHRQSSLVSLIKYADELSTQPVN